MKRQQNTNQQAKNKVTQKTIVAIFSLDCATPAGAGKLHCNNVQMDTYKRPCHARL